MLAMLDLDDARGSLASAYRVMRGQVPIVLLERVSRARDELDSAQRLLEQEHAASHD